MEKFIDSKTTKTTVGSVLTVGGNAVVISGDESVNVSKEYVDTQDEAVLQSANTYTDQAITGIDLSAYATVAELDAAIQAELQRATAAETSLKNRIDRLFDYRTNTLYLNN